MLNILIKTKICLATQQLIIQGDPVRSTYELFPSRVEEHVVPYAISSLSYDKSDNLVWQIV